MHASSKEAEVLQALSQIIDPDFGMDIVQCGFVKDLNVNQQTGHVKFRLELTTPACPIKDDFERKAHSVVTALSWVQQVDVKMDAVPPRPIQSEQDRPQGLRNVAHVIAVSSCKGGTLILPHVVPSYVRTTAVHCAGCCRLCVMMHCSNCGLVRIEYQLKVTNPWARPYIMLCVLHSPSFSA